VEEAVRAAEAAAAATPAVAPYRAYTSSENASANDVAGAATPSERRVAAATGVALVTPDATPSSTPLSRTPAGTPSRPGPKALDFSAVGKAADLAVLAALTPRGTPRGTPLGTPDRSRSAGAAEDAPRVFTLEEYARAATKLEGKKEALLRSLARLEELDDVDDHESAQDVESARVAEATRLSPRRDATRVHVGEGMPSSARRDSVDALAARRLVSNGLGSLEGVPDDADGRIRATTSDGGGEGEGEDDGTVSGSDDDYDGSGDDADPSVTSARRAVARLHRQCASLETRLRTREDAARNERARLSRRERDFKLAYARKAVRHLSSSLSRRALLAWVLYLDDAVKTRRLLRRAATKMRLRCASRAFESWVEYARLRRASRAERRLRDLQRRAEEAEAAEMEARRLKAAAAAKAAETASLVADAEARERRARAEVEAMRSRSMKGIQGKRESIGSDSDAE
jgi:hypothetical protein